MKIELTSRDKRYKFYTEINNILTVNDIKEYLSNSLDVKKQNIFVYNNDFLLEETVDLSRFSSLNLTFDIDIKNYGVIDDDVIVEDIDTTKNTKDRINFVSQNKKGNTTRIKFPGTNNVITVDSNRLVTVGEKTYLLRNNTKMFDYKKIIKYILSIKITKDDLFKVLAFGVLIFTNNVEILYILSVIFFMQLLSKTFIKHNSKYSESLGLFNRTIMMYIVSMFMIDHSRF
ncbi:hypothetical protein NCER_101401 [Vairimorpha ceranae BRL01]|uniref:Ubiquitin-like domain-containing protein n=2 Tax=Vairimorpha ceranae TaxID=40302 RepID=C4V9X8_VAIC1|nr:hypothetical protein AAJ76_300051571 [Vairimorpha ceranae]EEQ81976.1 hypothetical protein NCER_101401 [Vairimorpha ceranae BRL01]KAF5140157.1 hypothetical protein G9O61_00g017110 [Vairimorpha ceranae]KKO76419.1 hypothetical protein AAJ76_300051571 [Vairimorpha ceranae]